MLDTIATQVRADPRYAAIPVSGSERTGAFHGAPAHDRPRHVAGRDDDRGPIAPGAALAADIALSAGQEPRSAHSNRLHREQSLQAGRKEDDDHAYSPSANTCARNPRRRRSVLGATAAPAPSSPCGNARPARARRRIPPAEIPRAMNPPSGPARQALGELRAPREQHPTFHRQLAGQRPHGRHAVIQRVLRILEGGAAWRRSSPSIRVIWSPPKMLPRMSRRSTTTTPREVSSR